ncbi:MAG: glycosyltransferase family 39 protein [Candidatus Omnitrophica bacterium]|nr:glycosyltransferase family 39 protein [Candidatus Omnitrophota bacterium]
MTKRITIILISGLIIFHFVNNYIWLSSTSYVTGRVDVIHHLNRELSLYKQMKSICFEDKTTPLFQKAGNLTNIELEGNSWPPFVVYLSAIANIIFGFSWMKVRMFQFLYFIVLIIAVYLIGKRLRGKQAGVLAAFMVSMYPGICGLSRMYELDFPLTAFVSLTIYFLLASDNFKNKRMSVFFGVCLGISMLIKLQALFFIFGPLSYVCYRAFFKENQNIKLFLISMALALSISALWWANKIKALLVNFRETLTVFYLPHPSSQPSSLNNLWDAVYAAFNGVPYRPFTFEYFFFYVSHSITQVSVLFSLVFCAVLFFFSKSKNLKDKGLLLAWIAVPYVIFTVISVKWARYYFPSLPAVALISALGIGELRSKTVKTIVVTMIICLGLAQNLVLSYRITKYPVVAAAPGDEDWCAYPQTDNFMETGESLALEIRKRAPISQTRNIEIFGQWENQLRYVLTMKLSGVNVYSANNMREFIDLNDLRFIITVASNPAPSGGNLKYVLSGVSIDRMRAKSLENLDGEENRHLNSFMPVKELTLIPFGQKVVLWERRLN